MTSRIARWTIEHDPAATAAAVALLPVGSDCECSPCRNVMASIDQVFPPEFMAIASVLGVDLSKPTELTHYGRGEDGRHITGGFYHLIGRILDGADLLQGPPDFKTFEFEHLTPEFEFGFTSSAALVPSTFTANPVLQLEWQTTIDWCIPDTEPAT